MAPVTSLAKREAASGVPLTMGETFTKNIESDNGCWVSCEISHFAKRETGPELGVNSLADLFSTTAPGVMSTRTIVAPVERLCQNPGCGRVFTARASEVRRGHAMACSRSCASAIKARARHALRPQVGAANPNFRGWVSRNKRAYVDRFRAKYPEKARAHDAVKNALKSGLLVRPAACPRCGCLKPLHAHHADYSKPLDVAFACRDCHRELDAARRLAQEGV